MTLGFLVLRWLLRRVLEWLDLKMPMSELHSFQPFSWQEFQLRIYNGASGWGSDVILHTTTTCQTFMQSHGIQTPGVTLGVEDGLLSVGSLIATPGLGLTVLCLHVPGFLEFSRLPAQQGWESKTTPIKQNLWDNFSSTLPISTWCETPWQWGSLVTCLQVRC